MKLQRCKYALIGVLVCLYLFGDLILLLVTNPIGK